MLRSLVLLVLVCSPLLRLPNCWAQPSLSARIVKCKQGSVKGVLVVPANRELQPVEAFLGIPYASPPVGALRFMPPVSPLPWNGLRTMDKYGPACPQTLPDISNEREALRFVSRGRLQYLRRLLPYLRNQSEDCLYLNIYAPVTVGAKDANIKFPVIVFIHGESYEWNSGNPYDGSILASYGDVVVVTFNFRLGILGFLRPDLRENKVANFGLLDQIAALQWIKENIGEFGGNADSVTLMGHGTGAACVNLLLTSPVAQASSGLFHRAILMSGTALSDWAITDNPLRYTLQAAQQMNCPLAERDDELATCLRFKKVTDLMSIRLQAPLYASPLAPLVDGIVVPNEPRHSMKTYNELFGRYDVLYGVTQSESFHLLNAQTLQFGLAEADRNRIIRTYVRNNYAYNIDQVTAAILNEYTDWKNPSRDTEDYRDSVLEILSDARVVAPVVQMADMHSAIRQRSYFYVFSHQTSNGDFPQNWGSIHGEELAYVFGMPLVGGTNHLTMNYTRAEMLLSEMVITYWTNFARTGNPNFPPRQKFLSASPRDRFDPAGIQQWPTYDRHSQKYLSIELRPKVKDHYRAEKMALWSKLIPELVSNAIGSGGSVGVKGTAIDNEEDLTATPTGGFRPTLPFPLATTSSSSTFRTKSGSPSPPATEIPFESSNPAMGAEPALSGGAPQDAHFPFHVTANNGTSANRNAATANVGPSGNVALSIVIVVGLCFLVLNVCACAGVFYQRDRVRFKERLLQKRYKLRPASEGSPAVHGGGGGGKERPQGDNNKREPGAKNCYGGDSSADRLDDLPLQASTSTVDPHAKVRQWIAQEMVDGSETMTPPSQRKMRKTHKALTFDGSSGRYDSRYAGGEPSGLFPLPKKSTIAATMDDIQSFTTDGDDQVMRRPKKIDTQSPGKVDRNTTTLEMHRTYQGDAVLDAIASPSGQLEPTNPSQTSPTSGDTTNRRYSTTGRRKGRTKSQLSLHRSVNKRDVAVGNDSDLPDDDDDPLNQNHSWAHDTMDTIRRLNLPKVLPDLPKHEAKLKSYCTVPTSTVSTDIDPSHAAPIQRPTASTERTASVGQLEYVLPPTESEVVRSRVLPPASIVKTNLPHVLVMAPHPRLAQVVTNKANPSNNQVVVSVPEPDLVVRPGPSRPPPVSDDPAVASQSAAKSPPNPALPPLAVQEDLDVNVQLRRSQLQGVRPRSQRNSRSWYPQYSQSLISQSIDQDSDAQEI